MNFVKNDGNIIIFFALVLLLLIGFILFLIITFDRGNQQTNNRTEIENIIQFTENYSMYSV